MNRSETILNAARLDFSYSANDRKILSDFSLELKEGEILTLLGPSGCGKTTLLKLLSGFLTPDAGTLRYRDEKLDSPFPEGQMIFQDSAQLLPWLNVEDNILFPVQKRALPLKFPGGRKSDEPYHLRQDEVLEAVGLSEVAHYHPAQLSGGMKQRCALGRALMAEPDILFLDEPFGSLDAPSRFELQMLLLKLWEMKHFSMIFVTHDIAEALLLSDRIILFGNGSGRRTELLRPEVRQVSLPRPRDRHSKAFRDLELSLYSELSDAGRTL